MYKNDRKMKGFKGTKGKWFPSVVSNITIGVNAVIEEYQFGTYSQNVCEFILPETDDEYEEEREEIESNAKLISAAPELLEALQAVLNWHKNEGGSFDNSTAKKKAEQAINKVL